MDLRPKSENITVQKRFIHQTNGLVHKVGNITLDGSQFTAGQVVKAGTAVTIGKVDDNGGSPITYDKATPYEPASASITNVGTPYVTTTDVKIPEDNSDVQVGAIEEGYLVKDRITGISGNESSFVADSNYRYKLR